MAVLVGVTLVHGYYKLDRRFVKNKLLMAMMSLIIILLVLELLSVIINKTDLVQSIAIHKATNVIGFALAPIPGLLFWLFLHKVLDEEKRISRLQLGLYLLPVVICLVFSVLSYWFGYIFDVTAENEYVRGPLFFLSLISGLFYMISCVAFLWRRRKIMSGEQLVICLFSILFPFLLLFVQLKFATFLTIWNSCAIVVILGYVFLLNEQARVDRLTGLGNRSDYEQYIKRINRSRQIVVVVIDLDGFKQINDNFGHGEGDKAIVDFSCMLKKVFGTRDKLIRFGGDEFILFLAHNSLVEAEEKMGQLEQLIDQYNQQLDKNYHLGYSYGIVEYEPSKEGLRDCINRCDLLMYETKKDKIKAH